MLQVYHPNIDVDGNICLNILREDWKPVLSIDSIVYGLKYILLVSTDENSRSFKQFCSGLAVAEVRLAGPCGIALS